jgi:hypothetical protein
LRCFIARTITSAVLRVTRLLFYPVKSCRPLEDATMALDRRGPVGDRRFMVVDGAGRFVSQREMPRMCLVDVALEGDTLALRVGSDQIEVPRRPTSGIRTTVEIWDSRVDALEIPSAGPLFQRHLERDDLRLVYMPEDSERPVNPERAKPGDLVSFADAYPLLMISEESLAGLNARLEIPLPMERFRPNVVVAGGDAHAEDDLTAFRIGSVTFRNVKPCDRCAVTTVDPLTGKRGKEPLKTLADYRKRDDKVWFGTNVIHDGPGTLSVGDALTPL